jgi:hypothetical protein
MVVYLPRSAWEARAPRGSTALVPSEVENTAFHWPGMKSRIDAAGDIGMRRIASALRGWQTFHMDSRGWSDIAYQVAIDQAGRAWTLRGINIRSGANGDGTVNRKYGAILLILAPGEKMSAAMKATARAVVADYRKRDPKMPAKPTTHGAVRPGGTTCPGPIAAAAIAAGELNAATSTSPGATMAFDTTEVNQIRAAVQAELEEFRPKFRADMQTENEEYGVRFWVLNSGTGKVHVIDALSEVGQVLTDHTNRLIRIEDDTDDGTPAT